MTSDPPPPRAWQFLAASETDTELLATRLAEAIEPGTVVALIGNLGAGKTRLVRAIVEALGVDRRAIASPTFVLVHEYEGRIPIYHFDAYRLRDAADFAALGAEEYLSWSGVSLIEWADRVAELLPADHLRIEITVTGATSREFRLRAMGPQSMRVLERLVQCTQTPGEQPA
jgi:tRNA threonylcarbamoyladenosine biosynthesis protein TsaE